MNAYSKALGATIRLVSDIKTSQVVPKALANLRCFHMLSHLNSKS